MTAGIATSPMTMDDIVALIEAAPRTGGGPPEKRGPYSKPEAA